MSDLVWMWRLNQLSSLHKGVKVAPTVAPCSNGIHLLRIKTLAMPQIAIGELQSLATRIYITIRQMRKKSFLMRL